MTIIIAPTGQCRVGQNTVGQEMVRGNERIPFQPRTGATYQGGLSDVV